MKEIKKETSDEFIRSLFDTYYPLMKKTALGILYHGDDAEDVIQDSFINLMKKTDLLQTFDCCVLAAYIVSIVRNKSYDYNRKHSRESGRKSDVDFDDVIEYIGSNESLEKTVMQKIEFQRLGELFSRILDRYKNVILMKEIYGMEDQEIAQEMGIAKSSIRMYITRGRRALRALMEEEAASDEE